MPELREGLLEVGFDRYEGRFASDDIANNKLDLEKVEHVPDLRAKVVEGIKGIIDEHALQFDLVIPVPYGANWLGVQIATEAGADYLLLEKKLDKSIVKPSPDELAKIKAAGGILVLEDVVNALTNTYRVFGVEGVMERTKAVFGIWDRGDPSQRRKLPEGIVLRSLIEEPIPPMLPSTSKLWRYAPSSRIN